jgi:hypothetical protein
MRFGGVHGKFKVVERQLMNSLVYLDGGITGEFMTP